MEVPKKGNGFQKKMQYKRFLDSRQVERLMGVKHFVFFRISFWSLLKKSKQSSCSKCTYLLISNAFIVATLFNSHLTDLAFKFLNDQNNFKRPKLMIMNIYYRLKE